MFNFSQYKFFVELVEDFRQRFSNIDSKLEILNTKIDRLTLLLEERSSENKENK